MQDKYKDQIRISACVVDDGADGESIVLVRNAYIPSIVLDLAAWEYLAFIPPDNQHFTDIVLRPRYNIPVTLKAARTIPQRIVIEATMQMDQLGGELIKSAHFHEHLLINLDEWSIRVPIPGGNYGLTELQLEMTP